MKFDRPQVATSSKPVQKTELDDIDSKVDSEVVTAVPSDPIVDGNVRTFRYLGGRGKRAAQDLRLPGWFRVLLVFSGALLCLVALFTVLSWLWVEDEYGFSVSALIVEDYHSPALPPPSYARQTAQRLQCSAPSFLWSEQPTIAEAHEPDDFERFINDSLTGSSQRARVLYIRAYAFGESGRGYLIPSSGSVDLPVSCFPLSRVFDAIELSSARNIILILDCGDLDIRVQAGLARNLFADCLQQEFNRRIADWGDSTNRSMSNRKLMVLYPCQVGQRAWSSPKLEGSAFSLAAGYA